jgi:hypothetical protein
MARIGLRAEKEIEDILLTRSASADQSAVADKKKIPQ